MKKKTKIIAGAVVMMLIAAGLTITIAANGQPSLSVDYTILNKAELKNSISAKGIVKSTEYSNIYSTLNYTIKSVDVEVGDVVTDGQVLCQLDTEDLELNIAQQKADLDQSQKNSLNSLENNQRIYNETISTISQGSNSQLLSAQNAVKTAKLNLENAQKSYGDKLKEYNGGMSAQTESEKNSLQSAGLDLANKKATYEKNKILYTTGNVSKNDLEQSETAYLSAEKKMLSDLEQLENSLKTAQLNYDNAVASEKAADETVKNDLEKQKNSINSSEISLNADSKIIAIQRLEKQLEDSTIKAAMSGTVTAVYAKVGSQGTGLLFVIENTDDLIITTNLKEYDVGKVEAGMSVTIKSDISGDEVYDGIVTKIAPTSVKSSNGETISSSDAEFETEISVVSKDTNLKIGTNTRLNIILDKEDDVFFVPYDAVTTNTNGDSIIYVIEEGAKGKYKAKETVVSTGLETDFYMEISGGTLANGMKVANDASKIKDGMEIAVN